MSHVTKHAFGAIPTANCDHPFVVRSVKQSANYGRRCPDVQLEGVRVEFQPVRELQEKACYQNEERKEGEKVPLEREYRPAMLGGSCRSFVLTEEVPCRIRTYGI
jgi:hypothetical protein